MLGQTAFPFEWEGYTPYNMLPSLPKLKEHKPVTLTADQLNRLAGKYALTADIVLTVTVESRRHLHPRRMTSRSRSISPKARTTSTQPFPAMSAASSPDGPAQVLVLHLEGRDVELKRMQ